MELEKEAMGLELSQPTKSIEGSTHQKPREQSKEDYE